MKRLGALLMLAASLLPPVAYAQDTGFTPDDDAVMQQCFAQVADAAEVDAGGGASLHDCIGAASNACKQADPSTEAEGACNRREQKWWEDQLDHHYAALTSGLPTPTADSLRKTQDAWLNYRDARCDYGEALWGGSTMPITDTFCWLILTAERAIDLSFDLTALSE